ncbi:MAG: hypothetical protein EON91_08600 [Brevundimonas sp.]|uniref:hypothetical protein n=1 Tax=Brevundimonas sp. TaxID=1871086 RepID=UPI00121872AE|nr:hypothetical protein [Brevundimonas sp.]RZJ17648.1 MAG: hypothetical protein EON91_08600 [Brevundimonas sp.]
MSPPPLPAPADLLHDPDAFEAEADRQLLLCLQGQPNNALEWSTAKCRQMLLAAQALIDDDHPASLSPKHQLPKAEKVRKRTQTDAALTLLSVLDELRRGVRDPAIAHMFDTVAPIAMSLGMACHEVSPRTQEALGDQNHTRQRSARQAEVGKRSAALRTQWMRDLMPTAIAFLASYSGTQSWEAKRAKFQELFPNPDRSDKQIRTLLKAADKERLTILNSRSSTNSC